MTSSSNAYDFAATQSLRVAMGGYPSLKSLPRGVSDSKRLVDQIDASDRAFLRAGMSCDGTQCEEIQGFHPLMHALRESTKVKADRQAWVKKVKKDLWDAATALDRLTGGATVIVHTDCDMPHALVNRVENSFSDVYFTPHWQHSLDSQYQKPLAQIVNQFMSEIQVPAVEKHRAALEVAFGIKSIANKNLPNYNHNPATIVPSRLLTNLPTSPWRGRGTPSTVAEPGVHITVAPGVGSHNPTTPPRFTTTTIPSFPMVKVPWRGLNTKLPTGNAAGALADFNSSSPAVPAKVIEPSLTTASPDNAYGDAEWFASSDVLSAVDKASAAVAQICTHSPVAPSRTSSVGSSASTRLRCTPLPTNELSSDSDSDDERDTFIRQPTAALRLFARPFPHTPAQKSDEAIDTGFIQQPLQPFTRPLPCTPVRKPALEAFPSAISISSGSSISSISTSTLARNVAIPTTDPLQVIPAYAGFNPIIPPGPITEKWLMENGWAPQWGTTVRKVAEEYTLARWVPVLMAHYDIDAASAEALKHCIMKDFALVGSVSGSGPLGC